MARGEETPVWKTLHCCYGKPEKTKRLTLKDVETATRIPPVYLRVLEGGEGLMSDQVYLMPFLRTYANFLGMDTNAVVDAICLRITAAQIPGLPPPPNEE